MRAIYPRLLTIRLDDGLRRDLEARARAEGVSMAVVVRRALVERPGDRAA